jgi:hypothetical protein
MTANQVIAAATVGQLVLLLAAALIAWRQFGEARALRRAQFRPRVIVDFETAVSPRVDLVVKNAGELPAYGVRLTFAPPLAGPRDGTQDGDPTQAPLLRDGTDVMQAGSEYRYFVGVAYEMADEPPRYQVDAVYEPRLPAYPKRYKERTVIDLAVLVDTLRPEATP